MSLPNAYYSLMEEDEKIVWNNPRLILTMKTPSISAQYTAIERAKGDSNLLIEIYEKANIGVGPSSILCRLIPNTYFNWDSD